MKTTAEKIEVMQAFENGAEVERMRPNPPQEKGIDSPWVDDKSPSWNWAEFQWRVKPKPVEPVKAREWWIIQSNTGVTYIKSHESLATEMGRFYGTAPVHVREVLPGDDHALEIGRRWLANSDLREWFPFTHEELERLRAERTAAEKERDEWALAFLMEKEGLPAQVPLRGGSTND